MTIPPITEVTANAITILLIVGLKLLACFVEVFIVTFRSWNVGGIPYCDAGFPILAWFYLRSFALL